MDTGECIPSNHATPHHPHQRQQLPRQFTVVQGRFIHQAKEPVCQLYIPQKMIRFADMKVYLQGSNLFSLDNIGFADPEQLGAIYPSTRSYWAGIKFNF